jgi:phosphoribosylformylglycinamidine synthase
MTTPNSEYTQVQVKVMLKSGVLDTQGNTVGRALNSMGFDMVESVRIGKLIQFRIQENDPERVLAQAHEMAKRALTNGVIENYTVEIVNE